MKQATVQAMIALNADRIAYYHSAIEQIKAGIGLGKLIGVGTKEEFDAAYSNISHANKQLAKAVEQQKEMKEVLAESHRSVRVLGMVQKLFNAGIEPDFEIESVSSLRGYEKEVKRMIALNFPKKADSRTPEQIAAQQAKPKKAK